jgi:cytochrome c oxidase assembly factor CtaG/putative copper export protein
MTSRVVSGPAARAEAPKTIRHAGRRWLVAAPAVALVAMVVCLVAAGGSPQPVAPGLPDAGPLTGWGLPVTRLVFDLSAVWVIGALVTALLLPAAGFAADACPALSAAGWGAVVWAVSAAGLLVLTLSDVLGVPPGQVFGTDRLSGYVWQLASGRGLLLVIGCGIVLAAYTRWTRTRAGVSVLLAVAVVALLPVLFAGHSAISSDHDLATSSLVVHVVGASVWVGGLVGVLLLLDRRPTTMAEVLPRYSTLALVCFTAVAVSGVLNAWVRASGDLGLWAASGYGALLAVKITALLGLGYCGWLHRRRTVTDLVSGRPGAFARLAAVEVLLMAGTIGVAVALSRTPPPAGASVDIPAHGAGHATLADNVAPFGLARVVTDWRPEAISLAVLAILLGFYLAGVVRLRRNGVRWSWPRLVAAVAAGGVALLATSGGLAAYSTATFSLQVSQFLVLLVVVPALVALSAPVTLMATVGGLDRPGRPGAAGGSDGLDGSDGSAPPELPRTLQSRQAQWLLDPLNMLIVCTVLVFVLYATPLLQASLASAPLHLAVNLCTLAVGCLLWWSVLAVDPVAKPHPRAYRMWVLVGFGLLLGGIAVRIYLSNVLLAGQWFTDLGWSWVREPHDQRAGAELMAGCVALLGPLLAVVVGRGGARRA